MSEVLAHDEVVEMLLDLGLFYVSAKQAAEDARITWTPEAIVACLHDIEHSKAENKAAALWSNYLLHGRLPLLPKVKPIPDQNAPLTACPICSGPLAECHAIHGMAATIECWQCHKPMNVCQGTCAPAVPKARRTTRNKPKEAA